MMRLNFLDFADVDTGMQGWSLVDWVLGNGLRIQNRMDTTMNNDASFQHGSKLIFQWVLCTCSSYSVGSPSFPTFPFQYSIPPPKAPQDFETSNKKNLGDGVLESEGSVLAVLADVVDLVHGTVVTEVDKEVAKLEIAMFVFDSVQ